MADNVPIDPGVGVGAQDIATDDVGGVHYQKLKLDAGGDGASVPVVAGQQAMAASVPVVVASNQTAIPVSDGGGALTVDGTVAVTNADMTTVAGAVAAGHMQVDVIASALPAGAATSALQGGGLPAALGAGGGVKIDGSGTALPVSGTVAVTNADIATIAGAVAGTEMQVDVLTLPDSIDGPGAPTIDSYTSVKIDLAASSANQVLVAAPGVNKQIWVYGLFMMADTAAGTVVIQDEDDTALTGTMAVSDEGGWVLPISGNFAMPWIKVATNKALEADTGACTIDGLMTYAIVSV